jgi:hypothetical protein
LIGKFRFIGGYFRFTVTTSGFQVDHRRRVHISMDETRSAASAAFSGAASRDRVTSESDSVIEQVIGSNALSFRV